MVLDQNEDRWFANTLYLMGEQKGMEFMQALAKQEVSIRSGRGMVTQLLGAGEYDLQIAAYWYRPYLMKKQGAPVDWIAFEPAIVATHPISVVESSAPSQRGKTFHRFRHLRRRTKDLRTKGRELPPEPGLKTRKAIPASSKFFRVACNSPRTKKIMSRRYRELFVH